MDVAGGVAVAARAGKDSCEDRLQPIPRRRVTADGLFSDGGRPLPWWVPATSYHGLIPYLLVPPPHIERNLIQKLRV